MPFRPFLVPLVTPLAAVVAVAASACGGEVLSAGTTGGAGTEVRGTAPAAAVVAALATLDTTIEAITMDATDVYVITPESVYRIARDGATPPFVIAPTMARFAASIAVDDTTVYWTALESGINGGAIFSVPKTGGFPVLIASKQARPSSIALDATLVFWTNEGANRAGVPEGGGAVMSAPKTGGQATTLVGDLPLADAIALDGDGVVWHDHYTVRRIPKGGGPITTIESRIAPFGVDGLAVIGGHVIYSTSGSILSAPTAGGAPPTVLAPAPQRSGLAVQGGIVYFNGSPDAYGSVEAVAAAGGPAHTVVGSQPKNGSLTNGAYHLLADGKNVYWTDYWASYDGSVHTAVRGIAP